MDTKQLQEFLDTYKVEIKNVKEYPKFKLYILKECPFCNGAHKDGAYIIHNTDGVVVAKCHHQSCKDASWSKLYESMTGTKLKTPKNKEKEQKDTYINKLDVINQLYDEGKLELARDNYGNVVAQIKSMDNKVMKSIPVNSKEFRLHLQKLYYDLTETVLDRRAYETINDYIGVLAYKNNNIVRVYKRVAYLGDKIVYDLNKEENLKVIITDEKVSITDENNDFFHRSKYYASQVMPDFDKVEDGNYKALIKLVKKHFNFKNNDAILFAIYLVTCFLGNAINHPILSISGQKGSGKSSAIRKFCQIVDPKNIGLGNIPKSEDDISLRISENYVNAFDNLSYISKNISDLFCKCVTGGTNVRRTLYENNDETTFDLKSIVVLNGIDIIVTESDLVDRSIFLHLERFSSEELRTEAELDSEFEKDLPTILALCFSVLQLAFKDKTEIGKDNILRMADFYEWSIKIGKAIGYEEKFVDGLLQKNYERIIKQSLYENPLTQLILIYMEYSEEKIHSVADFLKVLKKLAREQEIDVQLLPKQPNVLSRKLKQLKSDLQFVGITYSIENTGACKKITVKNSKHKCVPVKIEKGD